MAKKAVTKKTKKTPVKKKSLVAKNIKAKAKKSPFKSKLGHDPLSWITGEEANELGVSFDEIKTKTDSTNYINTPGVTDYENLGAVESDNAAKEMEPPIENEDIESQANDGWGLFDDEPLITEAVVEEVKSDDGSWGLFADDDGADAGLPVGEGVAWGLFEENTAEDSTIDSDALTVRLPITFNVAHINKVYHDFELVIDKDTDVIVDASEVETIDATGLQLLYAAQKELQKRDCKLVIKDASEKIELLSASSFINNVLDIAS